MIYNDVASTKSFRDNTVDHSEWTGMALDNSNVAVINNIFFTNYTNGLTLMNGSNGLVKWNTSSYNSQAGFRVMNSSPAFETNRSHHNNIGIDMIGMTGGWLTDNYIYSNNNRGIYFYSSSPDLYYNTISYTGSGGSSPAGVYAYYYSSPEFGVEFDPEGGFNEIINNSSVGIRAYNNSDPFFGDSGFRGFYSGGNNAIYDNSVYEIDADSNSDVLAQYNWWGTPSPPSSWFYAGSGSSEDHSNPLSSDPDGGSSLAKTMDGEPLDVGLLAVEFEALLDTNSLASEFGLVEWARNLRLWGDHARAITAEKMIVRKFPHTPEARKALSHILHLSRRNNVGGLRGYFESQSRRPDNKALKLVARELLVSIYREEGDLINATSLGESIAADYADSEHGYNALYNLFNMHLFMAKDIEVAQGYLAELKRDYDGYEHTLRAQLDMHEDVDLANAKTFSDSPGDISASKELPVPEVYSLGDSYPNPFNPTVTIPFDLPEVSTAVLVIYDLMGREVIRLVDGALAGGYHEVKWNGRTASGQSVASGIYIYRLVATSVESGERFIASEKMVFLK